MSKYAKYGDPELSDIPSAKNDPKAMRTFLLQSSLGFKSENIITLFDPTFDQIKKAF